MWATLLAGISIVLFAGVVVIGVMALRSAKADVKRSKENVFLKNNAKDS